MPRTLETSIQPQESLQIFKSKELPPFLTEQKPENVPSQKDLEQCHKLIQKLTGAQEKIKQKLGNLKQVISGRDYNKGMGYYNCKNVLFIEYLIHLEFYELFKINAVDLTQGQGLALYQRLVYLKTLMTKLSPIQKKLQYQKNKLLKQSDLVAIKTQKPLQIERQVREQIQEEQEEKDQDEESDAEPKLNKADEESEEQDALAYQPRPQALLKVKQKKDKAVEKDAKYVPPKISAVLSKDDKIKRRKQMQDQRRKAFLVRKYRDDLMDDDDAREQGVDDVINEKIKRKFKEKTSLEEENFMRMPQSRQEKFWRKDLIRNQNRNNHLQDELKDIEMIREIFQQKQKQQGPTMKRSLGSKGKVASGGKKVKRQ